MQRFRKTGGFTIAEVIIAAGLLVLLGLILAVFLGGAGRTNKDVHHGAQSAMTHATLFAQLEADLKHTNPQASSLGQVRGGGEGCIHLALPAGEAVSYCAVAGGVERRHNSTSQLVAPQGQTIRVEHTSGEGNPPGLLVTLTPPPRGDGTTLPSSTRRVTPRGAA